MFPGWEGNLRQQIQDECDLICCKIVVIICSERKDLLIVYYVHRMRTTELYERRAKCIFEKFKMQNKQSVCRVEIYGHIGLNYLKRKQCIYEEFIMNLDGHIICLQFFLSISLVISRRVICSFETNRSM